MTEATAADPLHGDTGVDEEPVEPNRRLFEGRAYLLVTGLATAYAFFHMAALNGLSISAMTGGAVTLPFAPTFPMETWNFRITSPARWRSASCCSPGRPFRATAARRPGPGGWRGC